MIKTKQEILDNICYTELVYRRINKKLKIDFSKRQIEEYILKILKETDTEFYTKTGKNYYIINTDNSIRITVNSFTFRVITVDRVTSK